MSRFAALVLALAFFVPILVSGPSLVGAEPATPESPPDPPAGIGRIAVVSGVVSMRADAGAEAMDAVLNTPLTTGNAIETRPRAHASVDIGAGRFFIDGDSLLEIGALDQGSATVTLKSGAVILHILPGGEGQIFTIETPRGTLRADQPGYYEVEVAEDGSETRASALEGGAQFGDAVLQPGTRATVTAVTATPVLDAAGEDDFIRRVAAEVAESGENKLEPPKYVSSLATGFQDMARHGLWAMTEQHGWVWEPQVDSDWAPYRNGHWTDIKPWGATWIDDAPWGFAPFHYGRWVEVNDRWAWVPGDAALAPVYAPAVVSFFGTDSQSVGWVPLGPEEPYFPPYPVTIQYVRVINQPSVPKIVNVTNVTNVTQVTNVVKVVERRPVLWVGRLVNRRAATVGGGSFSFNSGGFSISIGKRNTFHAEQPAGETVSPGLITTGPGTPKPLPPKFTASPMKKSSSLEVPVSTSGKASVETSTSKPAMVVTKPGPLPPQFQTTSKTTGGNTVSMETPVTPKVIRPTTVYVVPRQQPSNDPDPTPTAKPAQTAKPGPTAKPGQTAKPGPTVSSPGLPMGSVGNAPAPSQPTFRSCTPTVGIACVVQ